MKIGSNWVKIKIIKHMISIYGSHFPGAIVMVPEHVAKNWVKLGIAEWSEESREVPAGMFWCSRHKTLHKLNSVSKKSCLELHVKEAEAKAKAEAEAEELVASLAEAEE